MKGYKGFEPGLICRGKQYAENTVFEEEIAYFNDVIYSSIFYENEDDAEQFVNDGIGEKNYKSTSVRRII